MKRLLFVIIAALISCYSEAQQNYTHNTFICSYYGEPISTPITGFASSSDAKEVINHIIDVVGLEPNFEIRAANIPNAAAIISSGKRFILYNPDFIKAINEAANDKWASIAILAHEIGHHLDGHTLSGMGSNPETELQADQFSGFVLRRLGASLDEAQLSMQLIANDRASATHPARNARLVSIENGWNKADAQITGKVYYAKAIPAPVAQQSALPVSNTAAYVLNPKYIQLNVFFQADRNNPYYITTADNLVTIRHAQLITLGKLVTTGNSDYPLAIEMDGKDQFYIATKGMIISSRGREVGYVTAN